MRAKKKRKIVIITRPKYRVGEILEIHGVPRRISQITVGQPAYLITGLWYQEDELHDATRIPAPVRGKRRKP